MTGTSREQEVLDAVISLVDSLLEDFDVVELLTQLTERSTHLLDVTASGLLLADTHRELHLMVATSDQAHALELLRLQSEQGPCLDCYSSGHAVSIPDLQVEGERWPLFVAAATNAGFTSVHAVPMRAAGLVIGTLGLFGTTAGGLSEEDLVVAQTLAHVATVAILQSRAPTPQFVLPRLQKALADQVVVEQAKGVLRGLMGVSTDEAFTLLRLHALDCGLHLSDVARRIVSDRVARHRIVAELQHLRFAARRTIGTNTRR